MLKKNLIKKLGFTSKENTSGIFYKKYKSAGGYCVEVEAEKNKFNFGVKIKSENKTTQNFSQEENWVVFECVNRLLEKGYKPEDITLEKIYPTGHGTSGRLDILVKKDKRAFLMIECKTWGKEFEKAFKKTQKDGGQLFTYFQQDTKAEYLMLYASEFDEKNINYKNEIVKIEEHYKGAGNVKDFYKRWNKLTNQNGIFEDWASAYRFENKTITKKNLKKLKEEDGDSIFNSFESILRAHSVSDAPNAFNKIFNLFLAKIFDEKKREIDELDFQWKENKDNHVNFQIRLINLYKDGMLEFLKKEIEGIEDSDFSYKTKDELENKKKKWLKFNKVFDIKEVFDDETFEDNAKVLKEVVQLLSKYQIRYPRRQQHLSNFFERLLTTGLKQKAGQFFTPPPVARFIIKSLPFQKVIQKTFIENKIPKLPAIIDYAAGSGHFLTEAMEEIQNIINATDTANFYPDVANQIEVWKIREYDWAAKYIYGIEKDYRLVKVAKVGCYFYGDGLAQVIYGDGLDSFSESKNYRGLLKENAKKPQFNFLISNPPYSVQHFKGDIKNKDPKKSFTLYDYFTDNSKEIEALFIERMKQILKEGGLAGIILPSSILSNTGIYTKTREILLKYFEIIAITEFGSNTFMATGTNTVVLFLRRRNNGSWQNIQESIKIFFQNFQDITANRIENIFSKYVNFVWEGINFEDYISLIQNKPNKNIQKSEIYSEYKEKIKIKNEDELQERIIEIEKEKLLYFILAYPQKVVIVKSGKKKEEKAFLGYEFSNRRGSEGIHPIQRGETIDECTKLFDSKISNNPQKISTYILDAFSGNFKREIDFSLQKNVSRVDLIDMMSFDRVIFDKNINTNAKNKIKIDTKYDLIKLGDNIKFLPKSKRSAGSGLEKGKYPFFTSSQIQDKFLDVADYNEKNIIIGDGGDSSIHFSKNFSVSDHNFILKSNNSKLENRFIYYFYKFNFNLITEGLTGSGLKNISKEYLKELKIPLPPKNIQEKIVNEIKKLETEEKKVNKKNEELKNKIDSLVDSVFSNKYNTEKLDNITEILNGGTPNTNKPEYWNGKINWATLVDTKNKYLLKTERTISEDGLKNSSAVKLPINTVIFSSRATIGDISIAKIEICTNQGYKNFVCDSKKIDYEYLYYVLKHEVKNIKNLASGMTYLEISKKIIAEYKIPLPNLSEQQKIVAQIIKIEDKIFELKKQLRKIPNFKKEVLRKYL